MTIISVFKLDGTGQINNGQKQYVVPFQVLFTGTYDEGTLTLAGGSHGLPAYKDEHPTDPDAAVTQIDTSKDSDSPPHGTSTLPGAAVYRVQYSTIVPELFDVDPWNEDPVIEVEGLGLTIVRDTDSEGTFYKNSAGDLIDPLPEVPVQGLRIVITRNERTNPASAALSVSNTVCGESFHSVASPKAKMGDITFSNAEKTVNGVVKKYFVVKYPIDCSNEDNGWHQKIIDNGYRILNDDGDPVMYRGKDGSTPSSPIKLDGGGSNLEADDDPVYFPTGGFKPLYEASWASLSLPDPFA